MKLLAATLLLAFFAGAGSVAIFNWIAGDRVSSNTALKTPDPLRSLAMAEPLQQQEQNDTATIGESSFPGSKADVEAELIGSNDRWLVHYFDGAESGEKVKSDRASSQTEGMNLPVNSNVRLTLKSRDFIYMLALPQINKTQVAVPGHSFALEFRTLSPGSFFLRGKHLCGPPRPTLTITANVASTVNMKDQPDAVAPSSRDTPKNIVK